MTGSMINVFHTEELLWTMKLRTSSQAEKFEMLDTEKNHQNGEHIKSSQVQLVMETDEELQLNKLSKVERFLLNEW